MATRSSAWNACLLPALPDTMDPHRSWTVGLLGDTTARGILASLTDGQVAQLVEHVTENHGVGGSIPSLATSKPTN